MLNYIWLGLALFAFVLGGCTDRLGEVTKGAIDMAKAAVMDIGLPLVGFMALWLGIMRLAEKSGMVQLLARALRPLLRWLFPDVPAEHPAMGSMVMNMAANMLGLSNAATPLGIRAMQDLETLNPRPGTASNAMCTFLAINTSSIQLIPATAVAILTAEHAKDPSGIIGTSFAATVIAAISAIIAVKLLERLPFFRLPPVTAAEQEKKAVEIKEEQKASGDAVATKPLQWWGKLALIAYFLFMAGVFAAHAFPESFGRSVPPEMQNDAALVRIVKSISLISIPAMLSFFPLYAFLRGIKVYEEFVEGAREGFNVFLRILPNLVAILVVIGMFRGAGGIDILTHWLKPAMNVVNVPPELLPMAIIRPLSGSGTLGVFTDIVHQYGADNILSKMAGTIFGSTETTFYVLAVYFGAVNVKRARHAVPAGLVADTVAFFASVYICRRVF